MSHDVWFFQDRPIDDLNDDAFGHVEVARQLAHMIRTVTAPATIGLLGGFGTGKSSIGNLLFADLKGDPKFAVVQVSIEKHSGIERQRALIHGIADALVRTKVVTDAAAQLALRPLRAAESRHTFEFLGLPTFRLRRPPGRLLFRGILSALATVIATVSIIWAVVAGYNFLRGWSTSAADEFHTAATSTATGLVTLAALLITVARRWIEVLAGPSSVDWQYPRAQAADEFERVFEDLAKCCERRLVVIVDDVDRLGPDSVLDALRTVKTLQEVPRERCPIFLLACDELVVRQAVEDAEQHPSTEGHPGASAQEYLNKLFILRQHLPPHLHEDMRGFADRLFADEGHPIHKHLAAGQLGAVLDVLIHDGVASPRHALRLVNAFLVDYRLALTREVNSERIRKGDVSGFPVTLSRLTVLRLDFPALYGRIIKEPRLLPALDGWARRAPLSPMDQQLTAEFVIEDGAEARPASQWRTALEYVSRTSDIEEQAPTLGPLLYLGQPAAARVLGSRTAENMRRALENRQPRELDRLLSEHAAQQEPEILASVVEQTLHQALSSLARRNALETAAESLPQFPEAVRMRLAEVLARSAIADQVRGLSTQSLSNLVANIDPDSRSREPLIEALSALEGLGEDELTLRGDAIAKLLAPEATDGGLREAMRAYIRAWPSHEDAQAWLARASLVRPPARWDVFDAAFFARLLKAIASGDCTLSDAATDELIAVAATSPILAAADFAKAVAGSLDSVDPNLRRVVVDLGCRCIGEPKVLSAIALAFGRVLSVSAQTWPDDLRAMAAQYLADNGASYKTWTTGTGAEKVPVTTPISEGLAAIVPLTAQDADIACSALSNLAASGCPGTDPLITALVQRYGPELVGGTPLATQIGSSLVGALDGISPEAVEQVFVALSAQIVSGLPQASQALLLQHLKQALATTAASERILPLATQWRTLLQSLQPGTPQSTSILAALVACVGASDAAASTETATALAHLRSLAGVQGQEILVADILTGVEWPAGNSAALMALASLVWANVGTDRRRALLRSMTGPAQEAGQLEPALAAHVTAFFVEDPTDEVRWREFDRNWPLLPEECRQTIALADTDLPQAVAASLGAERADLLHSWLLAAAGLGGSTLQAYLSRIGSLGAPAKDEVAYLFSDALADETRFSWRDDVLDAILEGVASPAGALRMYEAGLNLVKSDDASLVHGVHLINRVRALTGVAVPPDQLVETFAARLPVCTEPMAELLGSTTTTQHEKTSELREQLNRFAATGRDARRLVRAARRGMS